MTEAIGWLLDVYVEEDGITLWLLSDDGVGELGLAIVFEEKFDELF